MAEVAYLGSEDTLLLYWGYSCGRERRQVLAVPETDIACQLAVLG